MRLPCPWPLKTSQGRGRGIFWAKPSKLGKFVFLVDVQMILLPYLDTSDCLEIEKNEKAFHSSCSELLGLLTQCSTIELKILAYKCLNFVLSIIWFNCSCQNSINRCYILEFLHFRNFWNFFFKKSFLMGPPWHSATWFQSWRKV